MFLLGPDSITVQNTPQKGRGVFAKKDLPAGTVIGDYLGKIINPDEEDEAAQNGLYGLCWRDDFSILPLDIKSAGPHCVNHSCRPNAIFYPYKGHVLIAAIKEILSGEEITISYMIEPGECDGHNCKYICSCNLPECTGSMHCTPDKCHNFWNVYFRQKMGEYYNQEYPIGSVITALAKYPKVIPLSEFPEI